MRRIANGLGAIWLGVAGVASAQKAPPTLWDLSVDSSRVPHSLFLVSEPGADTAHVEIEVPYSTGFLEAGGKLVVTEEIDGTPRRGTSSIRKVGTVRFFDAATGRLISTIHSARLAGGFERVRFLCGSDDGRVLLFKEEKWGIVLVEPFAGRVRPMSPKAVATYGSTCFIQSH
jgi:hypothetical protein